MNPRVSIIIPAYNVENYIGAALESVINQNESFYEIIIVNDGSTDDTAKIIAHYADAANINILSTSNQGLGPARNNGANIATGDYIYFFDSDDLLDYDFVRSINVLLYRHQYPSMLLFSGETFHDENTTGTPVKQAEDKYRRRINTPCISGADALIKLSRTRWVAPNAVLYITKNKFWKENKFKFKNIIHEDEEIFLRLLLSAQSAIVRDRTLYYRRVRPQSIMTSPKTTTNAAGLYQVLLTTVHIYAERPRTETEVRKILKARAIKFSSLYIKCCLKTRAPPEYNMLLRCACQMRSFQIFRKTAKAYIRLQFYQLWARVV